MNNQLKTVILLGLLTGLLLGVGQLVGGMQGLTVALIFTIIMNFSIYYFSDRIVLTIYHAREATREYSWLKQLVSDVAEQANLQMPNVYIIPSSSPNAFATGRNPKHSAVAFTEGILHLLDKKELKGVVAHELAHIKNRDTLIQTVAATIAGVISYVAMSLRYTALFSRDREKGGNLVGLVALTIITPIIATLLQLALSRSREFFADETGAKAIKNPSALADALAKLDAGVRHNPLRFGSPATSGLFIVNPFSAKGIINLLNTHPSLEERIRKLRGMKV